MKEDLVDFDGVTKLSQGRRASNRTVRMNSVESAYYDEALQLVGRFSLVEDLQHWVNDALMVLFFFVVGLEIKRELVTGELRDPRATTLPAVAALGGVVLPALLFLGLVGSGPGSRGWGIPMATDIAFAVGVLALLGDRVPGGAKLLLLSIAIVDDILAIGVIAVVYTQGVSLAWLAAAVGLLGVVVVLRRVGVVDVWPYVVVGVAVWLATFESGVHATIAGVALGLLTPAGEVGGRPVLQELEHRLHPVSAFVVVPLFALANAGVDLRGGALQPRARAEWHSPSRWPCWSARRWASAAPPCSPGGWASACFRAGSRSATSGAWPHWAASASPCRCSWPTWPTPLRS